MKKTLLALCISLLAWTASQAQVVINEIMYNPPESGNDSLEYVEIYNAGTAAVNLQGYKFTVAFDHEFGAINLPAGGYLVLAINDTAYFNVFGVYPIQWTAGALNNSGEAITLLDDSGAEIDKVTYSSMAPWNVNAAGNGYSLELCSPLVDNTDPLNWNASNVATGITINAKEIFATPGAANGDQGCGGSAGPTVDITDFQFTPKNITVNVGETVTWNAQQGHHNVNGTQATFPANPLSFGSGAPAQAPWTYQFTFTAAGLYNYRCDPHFAAGMTGTVTVIDPSAGEYPEYPVGLVTSNNGDGIVDSLGVKCTLTGVVHSPNFRAGGLTFTIIDSEGDGIGIFSSSGLGYTVTEGDRIQVQGVIAQFNGLTQIEATKVTVVNTGNALFPATAVSDLNENTESQLVKILNCTIADPTQWKKGQGSGFSVDILSNAKTFTMRIDNDIDLFNQDAPQGQFDLIGLGGQFDSSSPYSSGYQINPRYSADILLKTSVKDAVAEGLLSVHPNPFRDQVVVEASKELKGLRILDLQGRTVQQLDPQKGSQTLLLSDLTPGNYQLMFQLGNTVYSARLVKQ